MLEFNLSADRMEAWIRDKELMIQAGERGEDYEHCLALQRKLDDVDSDMRLDESYVKNINLLAGKLIRQVRKEELNNKWKALQGALEEYRAKLGGALVVHSFNRDVDDTSERINEKAIMLSVEDEGKSLQAVEALQSRHEAIERDMTAIEAKIKEHEAGVRTLVQRYPDQANHIRTKVSDLQDQWRKLRTLSQTRKHKLAISYTLHKFLEDLKKMLHGGAYAVWRTGIQHGRSQRPTAAARRAQAEINGRQEAFRSLHDFGQGLRHQLAAGPAELVAQSLERLEQLRRSLAQTWEERHSTLSQCYQLQVFKDLADQTESWLASKEAFFNNDDLVEQRAAELANHYDAESIHARTTALCQRRDRLKEAAKARRDKLLQSKALHTFLQHHYEVESWMQEKLQVACDENYRDPTNLVSKIQKHAVFEAELGRVDALAGEGEQLLNTGNYASDVIQARLEQLATQWQECQDKTLMKKERLHGAYQALQFTRLLEDLDAWMDDIENQLQSEDHGRDLTSVQGLLKKHLLLELDINNHSEKMEMVKDQVANFQHHFLHEEVEERANQVLKRYKGLYEPAQIRRENLEDALLLHQFLHDAEDERHWLSDKTVLASSSELGDNLTAVQSLIKKHEVLEAEIEGHAPLIETVVGKGKQLVRSGHFASAEVEAALTGLQNQLSQLRDLASVRRLRLSDSLQSQIFYTELAETEAWLRERLPQLTSQDLGKDEASVQALEKKLEVLERDVDNYQHTVGKTLNLGASLVERGHFDATNISSRMAELEELYQGLQALVAQRHEALSKSRRLFTFLRDADEVAAWFRDRLPIANSDDFGKDVEHVEILIQRFEDFMSTLSAGEVRLEAVQSAARSLAQESHPEARLALNRAAEAARLRAELKDAATARMEALHGAKQVHTFDRSADETISWIDEKDLVVRSEDYGHDLPSIQTLIRLHQAFESELAAVKVQVEALSEEAKRLASKFPAAAEHIEAKQEEVTEAWNQLLDRAAARKSRLCQAEQLQAYFDEYRELMAWINEMTAVITSDELAPDVSGSQTLLYRHKQRRAEIETRKEATAQFQATGEAIISGGHFMASEIRDKLDRLNRAFDNLTDLWNDHLSLYEQYLDAQIFRKDAEQLEAWLQTRSTMVRQDDLGDSIEAVEELLHSHEDFMKTLEAQEDKLQALTRITKIEEAFQWRKNEEERRRKQEVERLEKERMNAVRRNEQNRILEERRTEDDLRADNLPQFKRGESLMLSPAKVSQIGLKRSESAKLDKRLPKRTPSFNTRHPRQPVPSALPPVEIEGFLERKQELQNGGKRATVRSWKTYYTVLCGQLLCFFKDKATFIEKQALAPPVSLRHAICAKATDYTKRKHVIRVQLSDGAKFLFAGPDAETMQDWLEKLSFHADLSPSNQLLSYDSHKNLSPRPEPPSYEETLQMRSKPPLPPRNPTQPPPVPARNSFPPEGPSQQQNGFSSPTQPPLPEPRVPAPSMMEDSEEDWSSSGELFLIHLCEDYTNSMSSCSSSCL
ncbi:SPTBN5 [Cordylochernes scorpioides]|uniref:SPTBN5 n=1 Tax=Cordylochernes scorpioides TaxID=51811 RepID=A0ABY6JWS1_9ARAC|nr:SPTBN5 [Cordylochernes scorpioides]